VVLVGALHDMLRWKYVSRSKIAVRCLAKKKVLEHTKILGYAIAKVVKRGLDEQDA
jgi:hypothetical protein